MRKIYLILSVLLLSSIAYAQNVVLLSEDFASSTDIPATWTNETPAQGNSWQYVGANSAGHNDNSAVKVDADDENSLDAWIYTPALTLETGKTYVISFWARIPNNVTGKPTAGSLEVKLGTAKDAASQTIPVYDNEGNAVGANTLWQEITYYYTPTVGGDYYAGFHAYSAAGTNVGQVQIDDVWVVEILNAPDCGALPLSESFETILSPCWTVENLGAPTNAPQKYKYLFSHSGSYTWRFSSYNSSSTGYDSYIVTPELPVTANDKLIQFYYRPSSSSAESFKVGYSTTNKNIDTDFTWIDSISTTGDLVWTEYVKVIPSDAKYVAIYYYSSYEYYLYIDDISISELLGSDAGVTAITTLASGANLTENEAVTVNVKNFGGSSLSNIPVKFAVNGVLVAEETLAGPIAAFEEIPFTFTAKADLSTPGDYQIKAYTSLTGDGNLLNDTTTVQVTNYFCGTNSTFPWSEGFDLATYPPTPCWISTSASDKPWKRVTTGASPSCSPKEGTGMLQYNSATYANGSKGVLITPAFKHTGHLAFSFWMYRDAGYSSNQDLVNIYTSATPDITGLTPLKTIYRNRTLQPQESLAGWYQYTVILPGEIDQEFYIAIEGVSAYGNNIYLDQIELGDYVDADDAGVTAITAPVSGINLTSAEVSVTVKNFGTTTLTDIPVKYEVNGGEAVTDTISGPIPPNGEVTYTFATPANLSATVTSDFTIQAYTALESDADLSNDTTTITVTNTVCDAIATFPWSESFENTTFPPSDCWISSTQYPWQRVTVGSNPTCSPKDGEAMLLYNDWNYPANSKGVLFTPPLALANNDLSFSFWMYRDDGYLINPDSVNIYLAPTPSTVGATLLKTVYRNSGLEPVVAANGWYKYKVAIPSGIDIAYIGIEGVSQYGNNIYIDKISVTPPLYLVSTTPADNATSVSIDAEISATFSEEITATDLTLVTLIKTSDSTPVADVTATINENKLIIAHADLEADTEYTVTITAGAIADYAGISWTFRTFKYHVTSLTPLDGATGVATASIVSLNFAGQTLPANAELDLVAAKELITIKTGDDVSVNIPSISRTATAIRINHAAFAAGTQYFVHVPKEALPTVFDRDWDWSFTTVEQLVIIGHTPAVDATNVSVNDSITVSYNRAPNRAQISYEVTVKKQGETGDGVERKSIKWNTPDDTIATIIFAEFEYATTYVVNIPSNALVDANENVADTTWTFTTEAAPTVAGLYPSANAVDAALTTDIWVNFNKAIIANDLTGITVGGTAVSATIVNSGGVLKRLKIELPESGLQAGTTYEVIVPANTIKGVTEAISWSFTTFSPLAPVTYSPAENAEEVEINAEVSIVFNKNIFTFAGPGSAPDPVTIVKKTGNDAVADVEYVPVTPENPGTKFLINHADFEYDTEYTVTVPAGNVAGYFENDILWSFTTEAAPAVASLYPSANFVDADLTTLIRVDFNKAIIANDLTGITVGGTAVSATIVNSGGVLKRLKIELPESGLQAGTIYEVVVPANTIKGVTEAISWSFTTFSPLAPVTYSPAENAEEVEINAEVSIVFNKNIFTFAGPGTTPDPVTIVKKTGGDAVADVEYLPVTPENPGTKFLINHADFEYNTEYTVTVPAGNVAGYFENAISWSFKTKQGTGLTNKASVSVSVYPTLSKGKVWLNTPAASVVKVTDLSGKILNVYETKTSLDSIDLNYADGVYFIHIENGKSVSTHKVILQR